MSGRPDIQTQAVRDHLRREGRDWLDSTADADWLDAITPHHDQLLAEMAKRGLAHRVQGGRYLVNVADEARSAIPLLDALEPLAGVLLERLGMPYYLSWHTALFHYGLLEQQASTVFCAVPARKRPAEFFGFGVRFVTLHRDRFFGIEPAEGYGRPVRVASVEKALLDALERPELVAPFPVVIAAFANAATGSMIDAARLVRYALETGRPALTRRIGFLMDRYGLDGSDRLLGAIGARAPEALQPGRSRRDGELDRRWRLRVPAGLLATAEQLK